MAQDKWSHQKVYQALMDHVGPSKPGLKEPYVMLYPQEPKCAVLYAPTTTRYMAAPLHFNSHRSSWRVDVYERIQGAIEKVRTENKGPGKESQNWTLYRVLDWDLLAAVGLAGESVGGDLKNDLTTILSDEVASSTEKESLISARLGQGAFRTNVLAIWGNRCSVTGSSTLEAIRASHIKPWRDSNNSERLDPYNGLPLVASLDALFDAGIISFDEKGNILVSSILDKKEQDIYGVVGKVLTKEPSKNTASYLQYHRANIYRG